MSPNLCVNSGEFTLQSVQKKVLDNLHIKSLMYSSSRPAAAVTIQLLFWTHFLREHKGTVLTKRNDLHQLAGCALIHREPCQMGNCSWIFSQEEHGHGFNVSFRVRFDTEAITGDSVLKQKIYFCCLRRAHHTHTHRHIRTHTHTHPFLYIFLNTTKTVQTLTQTGPHISSCLKVDCTLKSRVITEDSIIDNVKVYTSDLFVLKSKSCRTTFNSMCT